MWSKRNWRAAALAIAATVGCAAWAAEMRSGDVVEIRGEFDQMVFAAGEEVHIAATSTDDVVAAGEEVRLDGSTLDHVFLAGRDISFANGAAQDVFAAGGEIDVVTGQIADDFVAAGGRIVLGPQARVDGDVVIAGGRLRIESPLGADLHAAGGTVVLNGPVAGNVRLEGDNITIGPDAQIAGSLTHRGRNVRVAPEAVVAGQTIALRPHPRPDMRPLAGLAVWAAASILFGLFIMGVVIAVVFPGLMNEAASALRTRPWTMLALGVAIAILTPMLIALLAITLLGLPLAFVLGAALALLWPVSIVAAGYAAAMFARSRLRSAADAPSAGGRALWAGLAMIMLILVGLIPVLGFFAWLLAFLFGLGAVAMQSWRALAKAPAAA